MTRAQIWQIAAGVIWVVVIAAALALIALAVVGILERNRRMRRGTHQDGVCAVCGGPLRLQWVLDFENEPHVLEVWRHDSTRKLHHEPQPRRVRAQHAQRQGFGSRFESFAQRVMTTIAGWFA